MNRSDTQPETAHDNIFNPFNDCSLLEDTSVESNDHKYNSLHNHQFNHDMVDNHNSISGTDFLNLGSGAKESSSSSSIVGGEETLGFVNGDNSGMGVSNMGIAGINSNISNNNNSSCLLENTIGSVFGMHHHNNIGVSASCLLGDDFLSGVSNANTFGPPILTHNRNSTSEESTTTSGITSLDLIAISDQLSAINNSIPDASVSQEMLDSFELSLYPAEKELHDLICSATEINGNGENSNSNNISVKTADCALVESPSATQSSVAPPTLCCNDSSIDTDLEILDRELSAINAPMPLIDPEITQTAEQLEKAISSRKRQRSVEDESDRLVREALSQFYMPPTQRLISAIDDCPLDIMSGMSGSVGGNNCLGNMSPKRAKISTTTSTVTSAGFACSSSNASSSNTTMTVAAAAAAIGVGADLDLDFGDLNQNQKDFEVIMDALRLGSSSPTSVGTNGTSSTSSDSCGQAAMLGETTTGGVFHNLVVTSLET